MSFNKPKTFSVYATINMSEIYMAVFCCVKTSRACATLSALLVSFQRFSDEALAKSWAGVHELS